MIMTIPAAARPPKPERGGRRRYTPLPDPPKKLDMKHDLIQNGIQTVLINHFGNDPTTLVGTDAYLIQTAGDLNGHAVPDCIIAFGVEAVRLIDEANGYIVDEVGKPPDVVMEIASKSTGERDYTEKRRIYRDVGAPEYWRFDPSGGQYHDAPLAGDILVDGEYHRITIRSYPDGTHWGYSPGLGLYLVWEAGYLRFYDPAVSDFLPNPHEYANERDAALKASEESDRRAASANRRAARAERGREEERAARIESNRRAASANRRAEEERAARAEAEAARAESDRRAADAEAEIERLRRLLGDLE